MIELQECVAQRVAVGGGFSEHALQVCLEFATGTSLCERCDHLLRTLRAWVERHPELRRLQGERALTRKQGNLGGALSQPRVLRLARCFEIRARGKVGVASLQ